MNRLPGGVWRDGARDRDYSFREVTGAVELAMAEAARTGRTTPERISRVLASSLETLGSEPSSLETVRALAVGDRQFLVRQLAATLGADSVWLSAACQACGESFDFQLRQTDLPTKEAGAGFPFAEVEVGGARLRYRVPTGGDQEALALCSSSAEAREELLRRCQVSGESPAELSPEDEERVEHALEDAAPEVSLTVVAVCPECGAETRAAVDPYLSMDRVAGDLFPEVHALARAYHWGEREILGLPRERRRIYLDLLDRERGMETDREPAP